MEGDPGCRARRLSQPRPRPNRGQDRPGRRGDCLAGGSAEPVATDGTREEEVVRLFDRAMAPGDGFEPADFVVSNAGTNQRIDLRALRVEQFEAFWRVGCLNGFLVGREAARRLAPLGRAP